LATRLAGEIRAEHEQAQEAFASAVEHAVRCGELLLEAKAQVGHGGWGAWLDEHFPASRRSAQGYMRLARHGQEAQALAHLGVEGALRQLAAPAADRDWLGEVQALLPDLAGAEWDTFKASIHRYGVLIPVVRDQHGRLLDGRQRVRAADELGLNYRVDTVLVEDDVHAAQIAYSLNVARQSFTADQQAMLVCEFEPHLAAERERA
ncbi:MAG: DUF3102 domain-containing protein, partial [Thermoleophilaceae bacterium]